MITDGIKLTKHSNPATILNLVRIPAKSHVGDFLNFVWPSQNI